MRVQRSFQAGSVPILTAFAWASRMATELVVHIALQLTFVAPAADCAETSVLRSALRFNPSPPRVTVYAVNT